MKRRCVKIELPITPILTHPHSTIQIKCYLLKEIISPSSGMSNLSFPIFIFFASFRKTALVVRQ